MGSSEFGKGVVKKMLPDRDTAAEHSPASRVAIVEDPAPAGRQSSMCTRLGVRAAFSPVPAARCRQAVFYA